MTEAAKEVSRLYQPWCVDFDKYLDSTTYEKTTPDSMFKMLSSTVAIVVSLSEAALAVDLTAMRQHLAETPAAANLLTKEYLLAFAGTLPSQAATNWQADVSFFSAFFANMYTLINRPDGVLDLTAMQHPRMVDAPARLIAWFTTEQQTLMNTQKESINGQS